MEEELILTNPLHLEMESDGHGQFPDSYRVNKAGMEHIRNYLNKNTENDKLRESKKVYKG